MEEEVIQVVEMKLLPAAFGEVGPQDGPELGLVEKIDQFQLYSFRFGIYITKSQ